MKILVTGGSGFIGSHFVKYLLDSSWDEIYNVDSLTYAARPNVDKDYHKYNGRYSHFKVDITNMKVMHDVFEEVQPDAVVNFAAETHVDRSINWPLPFIRTNVEGLYNVLNLSKKFECRFVQVSTDEVYGPARTTPYREWDALNPKNPYSSTKAAADMLVQSYVNTYGVDAVITRGSNTFGEGQYPEKLVPVVITKLLTHQAIPVYGSGKQMREWTYVLDHARGIDLVMREGLAGEIYNISTEDIRTNISVIESIIKKVGKDFRLENVPDRPGHDWMYRINCDKVRALGWSPLYDFDNSMDRTVQWYLENQELFEPL